MPRPTPAQSPRRPAAWILLVAGLVSIVAGYVLLNGGSVDLAPALLVLGYVVLIPLGIIWQGKDREKGA